MSPRGRPTPELESEELDEADVSGGERLDVSDIEESENATLETPTVPAPAEKPPVEQVVPRPETVAAVAPERAEAPVDERQELGATLQAEIDEEREEHDEALHDLMKEVRDLREKRRRKKLTDEETWELAEDVIERFKESSVAADLRRALDPIKTYGDTFREKLTEIVEMGLKLSAWSEAAFMVKYRDLFGRRVEDAFRKREKNIPNVVERSIGKKDGGNDESGLDRAA